MDTDVDVLLNGQNARGRICKKLGGFSCCGGKPKPTDDVRMFGGVKDRWVTCLK